MKFWLCAAVTAGVFTLSVHAQSLADVAKKTAEQRKDADASAKVYTNKDLKEPLTGGVGNSPDWLPSVTPTAARVSEGTGAAQPSGKKDETYWRDRMGTLHERLDADQTFLTAAIVRERDLDKRLHRNADDVLYIRERLIRATVESEWTDAVAEVSRLRAAVENDKRAVRTAEEEARRADVPPAWLVRVQ